MMNPVDLQTLNISARLLAEAALARGYALSYFPARVGGETGVIRAKKNNVDVAFKSTATGLTPVFGYFTAEDKLLTFNLLTGADVPTPATTEVRLGDDYAVDFDRHKYVVKPTAMNHGDGITIGIDSLEKLKKAITVALNVSGAETALLQEQVSGSEYRFLVLDGEVVAVAGRQPASVVGDGKSSIKELIEEKNRDKRRGEGHKASLTKINIDDVVSARGEDFLGGIPNRGKKVALLDTSNLSKGGEAIDYTDSAHESLKEIAVAAAKACSLGLAGVDIMTDDIVTPTKGRSYVIEVNLAPGLRMHHFPSEGIARDVAGMVFEKLEERARTEAARRIGVSSLVDFVGYAKLKQVPARIDTGARTSSLWASDIKIKDDVATFKLFGPSSSYYTGKVVRRPVIKQREVTSSTGHTQMRHLVALPIRLHGKRFNAKFTLSDRSAQIYPILIGRNTLRGSFLVDSADPGEARLYKYPDEIDDFNESEAV